MKAGLEKNNRSTERIWKYERNIREQSIMKVYKRDFWKSNIKCLKIEQYDIISYHP